MRECRSSGSVRGVPSDGHPYRNDRAVCRLWGFNGAVACVRDALAGVGGGGLTIAVGSLSLQWPSTR
jgi:hypothetical protein